MGFDAESRPSEHTPEQNARAALWVSALSVVWTLTSGACAVALGLTHRSTVLVSFGAIGVLDAVGSSALIFQFRHALRHEAVDPDHERLTLRVVTIGMVLVGVASLALSARRLVDRGGADSIAAGIALAGVSMLALVALAARKQVVARRLPSPALRADGWLSATGAALAAVTVLGTGANAVAGWWWADPGAALVVSCAAIALGLRLGRTG